MDRPFKQTGFSFCPFPQVARKQVPKTDEPNIADFLLCFTKDILVPLTFSIKHVTEAEIETRVQKEPYLSEAFYY